MYIFAINNSIHSLHPTHPQCRDIWFKIDLATTKDSLFFLGV